METLTDQEHGIDCLLETLGVSMKFDFATGYKPDWAANMNKFEVTVRRQTVKIQTEVEIDYYCGSAISQPDLRSVIYALLADALTIDTSDNNFETWAVEYGYNPDSIKDLKLFELAKENVAKLNKLFTPNEIKMLNLIYTDF